MNKTKTRIGNVNLGIAIIKEDLGEALLRR